MAVAVSVAFLNFLSGPTNRLTCKERSYNHGADNVTRASNRRCLMDRWQERWNNATEGRWTRRLIPDIWAWTKRKHGHVNYHLTQVLSGHGSLAAYIKKIGKSYSDRGKYCHMTDTAEHSACICPKWTIYRETACRAVGALINSSNLTTIMLKDEGKWNAISNMCYIIMKAKIEEEGIDV